MASLIDISRASVFAVRHATGLTPSAIFTVAFLLACLPWRADGVARLVRCIAGRAREVAYLYFLSFSPTCRIVFWPISTGAHA